VNNPNYLLPPTQENVVNLYKVGRLATSVWRKHNPVKNMNRSVHDPLSAGRHFLGVSCVTSLT
jgi:hypothetical protein